MPKIIENARELLINEAKRQIKQDGYDSVTIRGIARGCGLGIGTFYNYFKSKDMLIASFLLADWQDRMQRVNALAEEEKDPMNIVRSVYSELTEFVDSHTNIFKSNEAKKSFVHSVGSYHKFLVLQLAEPIYKVCIANGYENAQFLSRFVAEAMLTWGTAETGFDTLEPIINKLFIK